MVNLVLIIEMIISITLIFFIYFKKVEIFRRERKKDFVYDETTGKKYKIIHTSYYRDEKNRLDYKKLKKYIKKVDKNEQFIVSSFLDFYNQTFYVASKERKILNKKEVIIDFMQYTNNPISNSTFAYYYENNDLFLYINSLNTSNDRPIKDLIFNFSNFLQKDIIDFELKKGRFYSTIPFKAKQINYELSKEFGIVNLGSCNGKVIKHDYTDTPNILVVGPAGSGKSNYIRYIINQLQDQADLIIVDWKMVDYYKYRENFTKYIGKDPKEIIDFLIDYEKEMEEIQQSLKDYGVDTFKDLPKTLDYRPKFLILEEYGDMINRCRAWLAQEIKEMKYSETVLVKDPKDPDKTKKVIKSAYAGLNFDELIYSVCSQGRATGFQVIVVIQRADAKFISGDIKNNFLKTVFLGEKETISLGMLGIDADTIRTLPDTEDKKSGYVIGRGVNYIEIPYMPQIIEKGGGND